MLEALDRLMMQGKIRYIGCSNYSGWLVMKSLAVSDRDRRPRFVTQQIHYTIDGHQGQFARERFSEADLALHRYLPVIG